MQRQMQALTFLENGRCWYKQRVGSFSTAGSQFLSLLADVHLFLMAASIIDRLDRLFEDGARDGARPDAGAEAPPPDQQQEAQQPAPQQQQAQPQQAPKQQRVPSTHHHFHPQVPPPDHAKDLAELDTYIDGEIAARLASVSMTWRKLDQCFKWRMLQAYLRERGEPDGGSAYGVVRELLRTGQLTSVEYDCVRQVIARLNHELFPEPAVAATVTVTVTATAMPAGSCA